jgi:hypothetical protein
MPGLLVPSASDGADPTLAVEGLFLLLAPTREAGGRGVAMVVIEDSHLADAETHGPTVVTALAPTVEAFFTERLLTQRQAGPRTVESYRDPLRPATPLRRPEGPLRRPEGPLRRPEGRKSPCQLDITDIDADVIGAFLTHLEHDRHNSVRSRNTRLAGIRSLLPPTPTASISSWQTG